MMKFFRKHLKKLLALFMCLLLISWLGGSALETLLSPDRSRGVVAVCAAGSITGKDWRRAQQQTRLLQKLGLNWQSPLGPYHAAELDLASWFLLQQEAHRMGIRSSRAVVDDTFRQIQERYSQQGLRVPTVMGLAARENIKASVVYDAATAFTDIVRYGRKMAQAATVNAAEIRRQADDALSKIEIKAVVLPAGMFEEPQETFPEAENQEQFDKFKNQKRSGTGLSFGYVLPALVKVQYAKIDPQKIENTLLIDEKKLEREANRYWRGNKQDPMFRRPSEEETDKAATTQPADEATEPATQPSDDAAEPTTQPADDATDPTTQPATAPAEQEPAFFTTWTEARETAIQATRRKCAAERAEKLAGWLLAQTAEPWYHADTGTNGYKIPSEAVKHADCYEKMLADAPASLPGIEGVTISTTDWVSPENVADLPGIGTAALPNPSGLPIEFSHVVFNVEGLTPVPTGEDAAGVDLSAFMALYQTCRYAMHDLDGNTYIFRPVEVDGERPPRSIDEVREQVVADLRTVRRYETAQDVAKKLHERALADGLQTAWEADPSLQEAADRHNETADDRSRQAGYHLSIQMARRQLSGEPVTNVSRIGEVSEAFLAACFEMREAEGDERRLRMVPIPESATVVLAEWVKSVPLDARRFASLQPTVARFMERQRSMDYMSSWLEPRQIKARNQFEFKRGP